MKKCSKCGVEKDESCFGKDRFSSTGLRSGCKECRSKDRKQKWANMSDEEKKSQYKIQKAWKNALTDEKRELMRSKLRVDNMTDEQRESKKRRAKESQARHPLETLISHAKHRATERGFDFDITTDDIEIPDVCPVLGIPLTKGDGKRHDGSPTIDRIDNTKGYVKGNVMVISYRANMIKNSASIQEVELVLEYMKKHQPRDASASRIV